MPPKKSVDRYVPKVDVDKPAEDKGKQIDVDHEPPDLKGVQGKVIQDADVMFPEVEDITVKTVNANPIFLNTACYIVEMINPNLNDQVIQQTPNRETLGNDIALNIVSQGRINEASPQFPSHVSNSQKSDSNNLSVSKDSVDADLENNVETICGHVIVNKVKDKVVKDFEIVEKVGRRFWADDVDEEDNIFTYLDQQHVQEDSAGNFTPVVSKSQKKM